MGKRASSTPGATFAFVAIIVGVDGGVFGMPMIGGEAGGLMWSELGEYIIDMAIDPFEKVGLLWSGNGKLASELVGLREPVGEARSDPVDMLCGGLIGSWWFEPPLLRPLNPEPPLA